MKKTFLLFIVLCIAAVVLFGCAEKTVMEQKENVKETAETPANTAATNEPAASQAQGAATPDIASLTQDGLDCLTQSTRVCLPVNYVIAKKGDTVGFAFGISNLYPTAKKFAIKVRFLQTQQTLGELALEADKDYMNKWLAVNDLESYYELQPDEKLSKSILVKIGDMTAEDAPTKAGAYVFEIEAQTYENGFYEPYVGKQQITVRVK